METGTKAGWRSSLKNKIPDTNSREGEALISLG